MPQSGTIDGSDVCELRISAGRATLYCVRIVADSVPGAQNFALHEHNETYLGKDCRVSGFGKAAWLADAETAEAFASARREHLRSLYGPDTAVRMTLIEMPVPNTDLQRKRLRERVAGDTRRVRARIRSGTFAPNVAPPEVF